MQQDDAWKHELDAVFWPKSIAMVGASDTPGSWSDFIYRNIEPGFAGTIYPVHPKKDFVWGKRCFKSLEEIEGEIDLVVCLVSGRQIVRVFEQCATKKVKAALVLSSGFAELEGEEGKALQIELKRVAENSHIRIIGPNCIGTASFYGGVSCFAGRLPNPMIAGHFGAVAQSGSFCVAMLRAAQGRGVGLSYLVSSGNEAVVETSDYIHYMLNDSNTKVVGAYVEGFKDPEKFLRIADLAVEKGKPLIVLKVGRSQKGLSACRSHTGSLAGTDEVHEAIFKQRNVIRVESVDEMIDTARILLHRKPISIGGVSFLGVSGGICAYISDNLERLGVALPEFSQEGRKKLEEILPDDAVVENPLDSTGKARMDVSISYRTIDTMLEEKTNDLFFYSFISCRDLDIENFRKIAEYVGEKAKTADKFVGIHMLNVESWPPHFTEFSRKYPLPIVQGDFKPIRNLILYSKRLAAIGETRGIANDGRADPLSSVATLFEQQAGKVLPESLGHEVLSLYGIPSPKGKSCLSIDEALSFALANGFPVALKIDSAQFSHKTDIGAVKLNIGDSAALKAGFETIIMNCRKECPTSGQMKILVQQMAPEGIDVILGVKIDQQYGPVIIVGMGGVFVELLKDTAIRVAPIRHNEALEMIRELRSYQIFEGYRGRRPADIKALADAIVRVSQFAKHYQGSLLSVDVNPLRVFEEGKGVLALDALVELK